MRLIPLAILCALVGLTYWVGATVFTRSIEQDITERSSTAIAAYKPALDIVVDGRDVTLKGRVQDEKTRANALGTVDSLRGVRATRDELALMNVFSLHGQYREGGNLTINGTVDEEAASTALNDTIAPVKALTNLMPNARPLINSGPKLTIASSAISQMQQGEMWINEERMKITGTASDPEVKAGIEKVLQAEIEMIKPLSLITDISVAERLISARCAGLANTPLTELVHFEVDSHTVEPRFEAPLQALVDTINECATDENGNLIVEAHTDHDGSEEYNYRLSQRRAEQVSTKLQTLGLDAKYIAQFAFGETRPIASNESHTEKSHNRRVEVRFIAGVPQPSISILSTQNAE